MYIVNKQIPYIHNGIYIPSIVLKAPFHIVKFDSASDALALLFCHS